MPAERNSENVSATTDHPVTNVSPMERGRNAQEAGKTFEVLVADAYRLLRYEVDHSRVFSGRQVDLFLSGRFGDLVLVRVIECKTARVSTDDIDAFVSKLRLVRHEYPSAQGTIVGAIGFTDSVKAHAATEGIQLTLSGPSGTLLLAGQTFRQLL